MASSSPKHEKVVKKPAVGKRVSNVIEIEDEDEKKDMLNAVKDRLKKSKHKRKESPFKIQLGKVLDDSEEDDDGLSFETTGLDVVHEQEPEYETEPEEDIGNSNEDSKDEQ